MTKENGMWSIRAAGLVLIVVVGATSSLRGQEESPILTQVKANLKDPDRPFTMVVLAKLKDGTGPQFERAFAKAIRGTRQEKGNRAYDLNRDARHPHLYMVYERWTNLAALDYHLKTPHITTLLSEIGDLLAEPPEVKVLVPAGE
jgi:quinol monooxygenase YgiN